ncbi:Atg29p [Arthroderma uncinatum]|uniref:Atg29p n=1 Tax=Arthroderma uncinatum TaxID=74035 RepID=UPI00144AD789|nr:Atg29p [Arthroderma uncinatum]KAF3482263.1 Atg29p [Arthroderma uncinatum]
MSPQDLTGDPKFTVFIRLPFPRGDFVDPPPVSWDARNDRLLWDVLSVAPKEGGKLCMRAEKFNVTLPFLLQHVAWLYDRRLSQVRAQIRRVGHQNPLSGQTTSAGGGTPGGSVPMNRSGSDAPSQPPGISNPTGYSFATKTQPSGDAVSALQRPSRRSSAEIVQPRGRGESRAAAFSPLSPRPGEDSPEPLSSSSSSSSSEDGDRPQYRRYGKFSTVQKRVQTRKDDDDDDEEEDTPAFLPLESVHDNGKGASIGDPASTLREVPPQVKLQGRKVSGGTTPPVKERQVLPESSTASSSSGMATGSPVNGPPSSRRPAAPIGPLSPRRTAELAGRVPHGRGARREGSEGSPSMGSSFSDLDGML